MSKEQIKAIVNKWAEENFTFIDETAIAELVALLLAAQAEAVKAENEFWAQVENDEAEHRARIEHATK